MLHVDWKRPVARGTVSEKETELWGFAVGVAMLATGMRAVTDEKDAREIAFRTAFYSRLAGRPLLQDIEGNSHGDLTFWRRWVGVSVNSRTETRQAWIKRIALSVASDMSWDLVQDWNKTPA